MTPAPHIRVLVPEMPSAADLAPYLRRIDNTGIYTNNGPLVRELELRLAGLTGAPHTVCVANGTVALELALEALGLPAGTGIALPSLTFAATATAVLRAGLRPVFCDIDAMSCLLSVTHAGKLAAEGRIGGVMPVSLFGQETDCAAWSAFRRKTGLPVVIDAAGAIGYQRADPALVTVFSLHATKPLASGEGAFVATGDAETAERIRRQANFGFEGGVVGSAGTNGKMSEYHAAVGHAALDAWSGIRSRMERQFTEFATHFRRAGASGVGEIVNNSGVCSQLVLRANREIGPDDLRRFADAGIETRRWYWPPLHRHPAFAVHAGKTSLRATESVCDRLLGVPWHLGHSAADMAAICDATRRILA